MSFASLGLLHSLLQSSNLSGHLSSPTGEADGIRTRTTRDSQSLAKNFNQID